MLIKLIRFEEQPFNKFLNPKTEGPLMKKMAVAIYFQQTTAHRFVRVCVLLNLHLILYALDNIYTDILKVKTPF